MVSVLATAKPSLAFSSEPLGTDQPDPNGVCLFCHETPDTSLQLISGESLDLFVNGDMYAASVHGVQGTTCVQCHTTITGYPHPAVEAATLREFTVQQNQGCRECHVDESGLEGVHQAALNGGNLNAAVCTDCHGAHDVTTPSISRIDVAQVCGKCHSQILGLYKTSVHGGELLEEGNPDTPTCTDCHGVHQIEGPSQGQFHLFSPLICARCHTDETLTEKYGLNPNVFQTYVSDFHGTTVTLFEKISPDQETNKPVCIDCHGTHDIRRTDDPESTVIRANLISTCQRCHPNATDEFPASWLGHYQPSWEKTPVISAVDLFYKLVIPITVIGMLVFIVPDAYHRFGKRKKQGDS